MKRSGFTFIEFMMVVATLGILAMVAVPAFLRFMKFLEVMNMTDEHAYSTLQLIKSRPPINGDAPKAGDVLLAISAGTESVSSSNPVPVPWTDGLMLANGRECVPYTDQPVELIGHTNKRYLLRFLTSGLTDAYIAKFKDACPAGTVYFTNQDELLWMYGYRNLRQLELEKGAGPDNGKSRARSDLQTPQPPSGPNPAERLLREYDQRNN